MNENTTEKCNDFPDVIFTPHFRRTAYLYHECSECKYHVHMGSNMFAKLCFEEPFKFCPNCGKPVVRFAVLPVFEEDVNRAMFNRAEKICDDMEDRIRYWLYVEMTAEERKILVETARFAVELEKNGGPLAGFGVKMILKHSGLKLSHWDIKKLKERIEKMHQEE